MSLEDLTPKQKEKAKACTSVEEILALAQEEGYELSDAELQDIAGGGDFWDADFDWCSDKGPCHNWFPK